MKKTKYLIVGAGISGLAFANFATSRDLLLLEKDKEIGGYCKTIHQDGFVWDFSGHFFHFRNPEIEKYLVDRMPNEEVQTIEKKSFIHYKNDWIDFPFQKNIHQLPKEEFIECLYELFFRDEKALPQNFYEMVVAKFGKGIADKFLIPYNEKLYACDLNELDANAMGRFFPNANLQQIIENFKEADNSSYNASFTYPKGGAIEYVKALASEVNPDSILLEEALQSVDLKRKVAKTNQREIEFEYLISSAPFDKLLQLCNVKHDASLFHSNKVLVFNLGFDKKGPDKAHWVYFPEKEYCFYRVGFYDNIFNTSRMSLYIEIGAPSDASLDSDALLQQTLQDLEKANIIQGHKLVSHHSIVLDPAYVHITEQSNAEVERFREILKTKGVYSVGRYGGWTYCAIEDNILETKALAEMFNSLES